MDFNIFHFGKYSPKTFSPTVGQRLLILFINNSIFKFQIDDFNILGASMYNGDYVG